jgi:hypothetical protein
MWAVLLEYAATIRFPASELRSIKGTIIPYIV